MNQRKQVTHSLDRRSLLRSLGGGLGLAGLTGLTGLQRAFGAQSFSASQAGAALQPLGGRVATEDYRALVYVFQYGGNDAFNTVVPLAGPAYDTYAASRQGLALQAGELLPIAPATPGAYPIGLHPALDGLQQRFAEGRLAIVANSGTLVRPVTKAEIQSGTAELPQHRFSHNDQQLQWQAPAVTSTLERGWGGLVADRLVHKNAPSVLSPAITMSGANLFQVGDQVQPYAMGIGGAIELSGFAGAQGALRLQAFEELLDESQAHLFEGEYARVQKEAIEIEALVSDALSVQPPLSTSFPENNLASQLLKSVARTIQARQSFGVRRQVYFVGLGNWDMHDNLLATHTTELNKLDNALQAFQTALDELGVDRYVTTFVGSEFGRTLSSNGSGSDHGWGGHSLVLGSSVRGDLYGSLPDLALGSPDDGGAGRIIPTTSTEQISATLAKWLGIPTAELPGLFPNLAHFATSDLGFLG